MSLSTLEKKIPLKQYLQGDGTKISPQESMRSQYKPNIQVLILTDDDNMTWKVSTLTKKLNFRQNLQHFQATRHFQESEGGLPNSSTINSAFYLNYYQTDIQLNRNNEKLHFQVIGWFELRLDLIIIKYWLIRSWNVLLF